MKKPTMDRPMLARVVIGGGLFLVLIFTVRRSVGPGEVSCLRLEQTLGVVVGALVVIAGVYLRRRGMVSP